MKILIPVLLLVILIIIVNIWRGFFLKPGQAPVVLEGEITVPPKKVEIDWSVLKNPILDGLTIFEQSPPLKEEPGRVNPFEPY